ncbi:MAG TPA: signal peptidase I, partial [Polyangia bacterium]
MAGTGKRRAGSPPEERTPSLLGWWRQRTAARNAQNEGRHLVKEAQRILRRKSYRIPAAVAAEINADITAVNEALGGEDLDQLRKTIGALDDAMDKNLAFARKSTVREYSESIGVAVAVALLLRAFVVEAFKIPSGSMIPTLMIGDHIFVNKFIYGVRIPWTNIKYGMDYRKPKRGEVIVFIYPKNPDQDFIKR